MAINHKTNHHHVTATRLHRMFMQRTREAQEEESLFNISSKDAAKVVLQSPLQNWTLWSQEGERFCMVCSYKVLQLVYTSVINYQKHIGCVNGGKPIQIELVSSRGEFRFLLVMF